MSVDASATTASLNWFCRYKLTILFCNGHSCTEVVLLLWLIVSHFRLTQCAIRASLEISAVLLRFPSVLNWAQSLVCSAALPATVKLGVVHSDVFIFEPAHSSVVFATALILFEHVTCIHTDKHTMTGKCCGLNVVWHKKLRQLEEN